MTHHLATLCSRLKETRYFFCPHGEAIHISKSPRVHPEVLVFLSFGAFSQEFNLFARSEGYNAKINQTHSIYANTAILRAYFSYTGNQK